MTPEIDTRHPNWCDPRYCDGRAHGSVHHCSAPINFRIDGGDAEVVISRSQYDTHVPDGPTYHIQVCRHDVEGESVEVEWNRRDTEHLLHVLEYLDSLN